MAPIPIAVGDIIPDGELTFINKQKQGRIERASIYSLITNKKVFISGVIGAFFPRCSSRYVPSLIEKVNGYKREVVVLCISVNDPFVMRGWELASFNHNKHVKFLADSTGAYVRSLGLLEVDLSYFGFGIRSRRFLLTVEDRKVTRVTIHMTDPPKYLLDKSKVTRTTIPMADPPKYPLEDISAHRRMAPIAVGDIIPDGQFRFLDGENKFQKTSVYSIATGKTIMLFGIPGAFETTFSTKYVYSIIRKADVLRSNGIQEIYCIGVNDPYVMRGWELAYFKNNGHIKFLPDGGATYVKSLGLEVDLSSMELGIRSRRFCLVVDDLKVMVAKISKRFGTEDLGTDISECIKSLNVSSLD